jgi:hypothetical protein
MKYGNLIFSFMFVCVFSLRANAAELVCSGKVAVLSYHSNNQFMVQLESMNAPVFFCNPDAQWSVSGTTYITGPETCKAIYSTFLAAQMSGKIIHSLYFDGAQVPASCNSWGAWSNANIRHYQLKQ